MDFLLFFLLSRPFPLPLSRIPPLHPLAPVSSSSLSASLPVWPLLLQAEDLRCLRPVLGGSCLLPLEAKGTAGGSHCNQSVREITMKTSARSPSFFQENLGLQGSWGEDLGGRREVGSWPLTCTRTLGSLPGMQKESILDKMACPLFYILR